MSEPAAEHHKIVIVGGGTAGVTGRPADRADRTRSPSSTHRADDYEPLFAVVGGGRAPQSATVRPEASVMPKGVR